MNKTYTWEWEWEGMRIDCMGTGGSGDVKVSSRSSPLWSQCGDMLSTCDRQTTSVVSASCRHRVVSCRVARCLPLYVGAHQSHVRPDMSHAQLFRSPRPRVGSGTFRIHTVFPWLRRFVYLVLRGAGRRAKLMYTTMGSLLL